MRKTPEIARRSVGHGWGRHIAMMRDAGIDAPPRMGSPSPSFPIQTRPLPNQFAPPPLADRYPIIIGQKITVSYMSSVFRLGLTGYRMQLVDLLDEILDMDPHLASVVTKRVMASANGRFQVTPAEAEEGSSDDALAKAAADMVRKELSRIPDLTQSISALLWGIYYGLSAAEIFWTKDADGWHVERLGFVHSRRLSYPDMQSWSLHIWDQGQVFGWNDMQWSSPTNTATFGLRVADFPGKFIVYAPQLRGGYPTRDGLGRQCAAWALFKRVGARGAVDYLERFAKPIMDVSFSTQDDGNPREATNEDIELAAQIAASIGPGASNYASHADSIKVEPKNADGTSGGSKLTWPEWMTFCDGQMSKACLGGTLGTEVGHAGGNRSLGETQQRGEVSFEQYDGSTVAEAFRRDVVTWLVRLNMPEAQHVVPQIAIHVDKDPEPKAIAELVERLTNSGIPVDADAVCEEIGIPLVPNETEGEDGKPKPRRTYKSDFVDPHTVDPSLMSDEAKQEKEDDKANDHLVEMTKAKQPKVLPGGGAFPASQGEPSSKAAKGKPPAKKGTPAKGLPKQKGARKFSDKPGEAAICIVRDSLGNVLTVSRPEEPHEMALPGGGVDDGETPAQAAIRELAEECGIRVLAVERVVLSRSVGGWAFLSPDGTRVHVFQATDWEGTAAPMEPTSRVAWLSVPELRAQSSLYRDHVDMLIGAGALDEGLTALELDQRDTIALLLNDKAKHVPRDVFDQLLEDYPAKSLSWVLAAHWSEPHDVPIADLNFADSDNWRASHDPIQPYIDRIHKAKGDKPAGVNKPVILVQVPGEEKLLIVDGHHRVLACKEMGIPVLAYVAKVHHDAPDAPWRTLHSSQRKGSSKGSFGSFVSAA